MTFDVKEFRTQFPILNTEAIGCRLRYLDNASTTLMPDTVLSALLEFETNSRANVARAGHLLATKATDAYEQARAQVARYLNIENPEEVIFTSGTTASINLLAHSLGSTLKPGDEVVISLAEHHSNFVPWQMMRDRAGIVLKIVPLTEDGRLDLNSLDTLVTDKCKLIAVTHASNVTGAITEVDKIVATARKVGAQVLLDGAQAAAHGPVDLPALGVDYYAFSGHKCFGPTGVGVLWGRSELLEQLPPFMGGGGIVERVTLDKNRYAPVPSRFEAGTPPIAQAVALGAALKWLMELRWEAVKAHEQHLTRRLLQALESVPGLFIIGPRSTENRLPLFSFDIDGIHPHDLCHILDQQGVALRGGHHCAQPLMDALDLMAASRASLTLFNDDADIDTLKKGLNRAIEILL